MSIRFRCKCGKVLKAPDRVAGKRIKCPSCGIALIAPTPRPSPDAVAESPALTDTPKLHPPDAPVPPLEMAPPPPAAEPPAPESPSPTVVSVPGEGIELELELPAESDSRVDAIPGEKAPEPEPPSGFHLQTTAETETPPPEPADLPQAATPQPGATCPHCNAAVAPDAVLCVECGKSLKAEQPAEESTESPAEPSAAASQPPATGLSPKLLFVFIPVGLAVLAGIIYMLSLVISGPTKQAPAPETPAAAQPQPAEPSPATPEPSPTPAPKPKAPPQPSPAKPPAGDQTPASLPTKPAAKPPESVPWAGFSDPALRMRGALLDIGERLARHREKGGPPPGTLAEVGAQAADTAGLTYVGPEVVSLNRFAPIVYETRPNPSGGHYALFPDGSARLLSRADLSAALLQRTPAGWMAKADTAALSAFGPKVQVANPRFASLEVYVDDTCVGRVGKGASQTFAAPVGAHRLVFGAYGERTKDIACTFRPGLVYEYAYPTQCALPLIPVQRYRAIVIRKRDPTDAEYTRRKAGSLVAALHSETEKVLFPKSGGWTAIPRDYSSIDARIERGDITIEGLKGQPILVNRIGRIEEGVATARGAPGTRYHRTALGTLSITERPNAAIGAAARLRAPERTTAERQETGRGHTRQRKDEPLPPEARQKLRHPVLTYKPLPDWRALATLLAPSAAAVVPPLRGQLAALTTRRKGEEDTSPDEPDSAAAALAVLALLGDASQETTALLFGLGSKLPAGSPAHGQLTLALARSAGGSALLQIRSAATHVPVASAIALSMIDAQAARTSLRSALAGWSAADAAHAGGSWPALAGPRCRRVFVEQFVAAHRSEIDDAAMLNGLMAVDPFALEHTLAAMPIAPLPESPGAHSSRGTSQREQEQIVHAPPPTWIFLARMRNPRGIRGLIAQLNAKDPATRMCVLTALGEVRDSGLLPVVSSSLKDGNAAVRAAAVKTILTMGDPAAVQALHDAMDAKLLFATIPAAAPRLAGDVGPELTARLLAKMLTVSLAPRAKPKQPEEPKPEKSKSKRGGQERQPALPAELPTPKDASPEQLLAALAELGVQGEDVEEAIKGALKSPTPAVRAASYRALATLRGPSRQPAHGSLLRGVLKLTRVAKPTAPVATPAAPRADTAIATAAAALKDPDASVRATGLRILHGASAQLVAPMLGPAMTDKAAEIRAAAMETIPSLTGNDARISKLIAAGLADGDPGVRAFAAQAAVPRKDPSLAGPLLAILNRPTGQDLEAIAAVAAAIDALGGLREPRAVTSLSLLLVHQAATVRAKAAAALAAIGDASAIPSLTKAVLDTEPAVAAAVALALASFDSPQAVSAGLAGLANTGLPEDARRQLLTQLITRCAKPGPYAQWATHGQALDSTCLATLAQIAQSAPKAQWPGILVLVGRYLSDSRAEARVQAAEILNLCGNESSARALMIAALRKDASAIAAPAAKLLRRPVSAEQLNDLWRFYKALADSTDTRQQLHPGLAKASPDENEQLCRAVIAAIGATGGDEAGRILWRIMSYEKRAGLKSNVTRALDATRVPGAVKYLSDTARLYPACALDAAVALGRIGHLQPDAADAGLKQLSRSNNSEIAATALDAMDEMRAAKASQP